MSVQLSVSPPSLSSAPGHGPAWVCDELSSTFSPGMPVAAVMRSRTFSANGGVRLVRSAAMIAMVVWPSTMTTPVMSSGSMTRRGATGRRR